MTDRKGVTPPRARELGLAWGDMEPGALDKITDVPGVTVGHATVHEGDVHTGVTVVLPGGGNPFARKLVAASYVHNGFGKSCGLVQIDELGLIETPIALTNTLCVGRVADALVGHVLDQCAQDGTEALSISPVVGECNDSDINDIRTRTLGRGDLDRAIAGACRDFAEGSVGAGTATRCFGLKGGIGSASRVVRLGDEAYTVGVLVQSNYGSTEDLVLGGVPLGRRILEEQRRAEAAGAEAAAVSHEDRGSIMTVVATDLPVSSRQLKRIVRRAGVGIARTGAYTGHGSGEVMIGFSTANRVDVRDDAPVRTCRVMAEQHINLAFKAVAEATHEAIVNSMLASPATRALDGRTFHSLSEYVPRLL